MDWLSAQATSRLSPARSAWLLQAQRGQLPDPFGDWATWLLLGGRGAGKTRAGAEWIALLAETRPRRFALVGPTLHDVREVMIEGPSGLRALSDRARRPSYSVSRRILSWPNGAEAHAFSAEDSDSLRGPQFHAAWADEFCAWPEPAETLAQLRLGLRLGTRPRLMVTTTPKPIAALRKLMAEPSTATRKRTTAENADHLAPTFLDGLRLLYGGTRLEAQELEGRVVEAYEGALWKAEDFARCRGPLPAAFERVVVGVDPPSGMAGAACGIVAVGRFEGRAYVLADDSVKGLTPAGWAGRAARTAAAWNAAAIVAEANQGGEMVRSVLTTAGCPCPVRLTHARIGKRARAEPVAALYERGRIAHCGRFDLLEEELMSLGAEGAPSPDRADALVWAITELLLRAPEPVPRIRVL